MRSSTAKPSISGIRTSSSTRSTGSRSSASSASAPPAAAVEAGTYDPDSLTEVAARDDALGRLARVFSHMACEVAERERGLVRQVQQLRIEIDRVRTDREVSEITDTDFFRDLTERARTLRERS